ncbi:hypothetical protein ABIF78_009389 [Bradyrhizobium japonicum]
MGHLHQPHLAQDVVVLVQRQPVDADRDGAATFACGGDRGEPRAQMHVRAEIGDDARAGGCDHLQLIGTSVDAVRQRQPLREEADIAQPTHHVRKVLVGPGALIDGLQQMHVNAAARLRRVLRHRLQQRLRTPLHAGGSKLHVDHRAGDGGGNRIGQLDIGLRRHRRADEEVFDGLAVVTGEAGENRLGIAINDRILVPHREGKCHADADIGCRPRNRLGFIEQRHRPARAGVVHHHRRATSPGGTCQCGGRGQIGIDGRTERGAQDPAFEGHADRPEGRRGRARMVMGVDEGRNDEGARPASRPRSFKNVGDDTAIVPQHDIVGHTEIRATEQAGCRNLRGHDGLSKDL